MNNFNANKRIAKNSLILSIRMVIVLCINLYTTREVLSLLGVEDYGVYNVVCGFVSMFVFLNTSMSNGIQRFFNYELGKNGAECANNIFCTSVLIQFLLAIVVIVLCESFGLWYLHNKMVIPDEKSFAAEWIFQFSVLSFLFVIFQAPFSAAVMAHEHMDFYAVINIIDAVLKLIIVFIIPLFEGDSLVIYGLLLTVISLFDFAFYFFYCKRNFKEIRLRLVFHKNIFKSMLCFSGWNLFGSFSNMMRDQGINLIMNLFYGPVVNAARGIAVQINAGLNGFVANILTPVRPQVIQSYAKGEFDRSIRLTYSISKFSVGFLYMMALPVCLEINYILKLWLGEHIPKHTEIFVLIILVTSAVLILMGALATLVHASGVMRRYQLYGSIVKFLSVPIAFLMLKCGAKPEWALIMVLIFDIVGFIVGMFIIKGIMPFSIADYLKNVVIPLVPVSILTLILSIPIVLLMEQCCMRLICVTCSCIVGVLLTFYLFALSSYEKPLIIQFINKIARKIGWSENDK